VLGALAAGCGSTSTYRVMLGRPGPVVANAARVRLSRLAHIPGFRVREVALVQAIGRGSHADLAHLAEGLEAEAISLGCNAIVRFRVDQGTQQAVAIGIAAVAEPGVDPVESTPESSAAAPWRWPAAATPTGTDPASTQTPSSSAPTPPPASPGGLTAPWQR